MSDFYPTCRLKEGGGSFVPVSEVRGNRPAAVSVGAAWTLILDQFYPEH